MKWRYATFLEALPYMFKCPELRFITPNRVLYKGVVLRRIIALEDNALGHATTGTVGGFVQKDSNLSQHHEAWIADCALVYEDAKVSQQALVKGKAKVHGKVKVYGNAEVTTGVDIGGKGWIDNNMHEGEVDSNDWLCCG